MHLSAYGLKQYRFRLVAAYKCYSKGKKCLNIDCYADNKGNYLVRNFYSGGRAWDNLYTNKDDANTKVVELWRLYKWHKRIV